MNVNILAGKYVPELAEVVYDNNNNNKKNGSSFHINLKGILVRVNLKCEFLIFNPKISYKINLGNVL